MLPTAPQGGTAPASKARREGKQLPGAVPLGCAAQGVHLQTGKELQPAWSHQEGSQMELALVTWSFLLCVTPVSIYWPNAEKLGRGCQHPASSLVAQSLENCGEMHTPRHLWRPDSKATQPAPETCSGGDCGLIALGMRTTSPTHYFTH